MPTAADIMTRDVVTVSTETPVREVADILAKNRFGSVPVVAQDGLVLGLVREEDMVERAAEVHLPRHVTFLGGIIYLENPQRFEEEAEKILAMNARDIMDTNVPTISPTTPVDELASRMLSADLRRLLVLDDQRHLLGIITRADIIRMQITGDRLPNDNGE
ncbi:MAG: CBS domain-containing protein [Armatimonadota bacterium]